MKSYIPASMVLLSLSLTAAHASGREPVSFDDRRFNVQLRSGFGSSVGVGGIVAEVDLLDRFNVGVGVGSNMKDVIVGAHARVRPVIWRDRDASHALVLEGAVSRSLFSGSLDVSFFCEGGPPDDPSSPCFRPLILPEWVWWGQLEFGWEMRTRGGLLARTTGGFGRLLAEPDWQCLSRGAFVPCRHVPEPVIATMTVAVGYAF